jgi:hypothetical protein
MATGIDQGLTAVKKQLDEFFRVVQQSVNLIKVVGSLIVTGKTTTKTLEVTDGISFPGQSNLLVNGGFEIWQRGNGPFTVSAAYTADRWTTLLSGTGTLSVSKDTTNVDTGSSASSACTSANCDGTLTNTAWCGEHVEGGSIWAGQTWSFSVRVKTSVSGIYADLQYIDSGVTVVNNYSSPHPGDGQWHTLTVTVTFPATATDLYVYVNFRGNGIVYVDNAMLVAGSVPATYTPLPIADEWARCERYYEVRTITFRGQAPDASGPFIQQSYHVHKVVVPTVSLTGGTPLGVVSSDAAGNVDIDGFTWKITCTGAGIAEYDGRVFTAEANP